MAFVNCGTLEARVATLEVQVESLSNQTTKLASHYQSAGDIVYGPQPGITALEYTMLGLAFRVGSRDTTRSIFMATGQLGNTGNNQETRLTLVWGYGAPPAFGTLLINSGGQEAGSPSVILTGRSDQYVPFSQVTLIETAERGDVIWVDIAMMVSGGASILTDLELVGFDLIDTIGVAGPKP